MSSDTLTQTPPASGQSARSGLISRVGGVPGMLALPAGVWAAARWGYAPVFAVTTAATLLAVLSVPGLPRRPGITGTSGYHGVLAGLLNPALTRPAAIFATSTAAVGVLVTFLPLATTSQPAWVAAGALFAQPAASTLARCVAGQVGDRHGQACLLVPGLLLAAAGMACLAATGTPSAVIGGALVFGIGFGLLQNATLVLMYSRVPAGGEGAVSAIWNAAYDLGMGAGALCTGLVVTALGYPAIFLLSASLVLPAFIVLRRDNSARRGPTNPGGESCAP